MALERLDVGRLSAVRSLVEMATAPRAGFPDPLPEFRRRFGLPDTADLTTARADAVRRLHEEILREELPLFGVLKDAPPPRAQAFPPPLSDGEKLDVTALLEVGQESPTRLAKRNFARMPQVARLLGLATYTAAGSVAERVGRRVGRLFRS